MRAKNSLEINENLNINVQFMQFLTATNKITRRVDEPLKPSNQLT